MIISNIAELLTVKATKLKIKLDAFILIKRIDKMWEGTLVYVFRCVETYLVIYIERDNRLCLTEDEMIE